MAKTLTLHDLLVLKLSALVDIETVIVEALPRMIDHAHHQGLKKIFREHLAEARNHVCRLEDSFKLLRERPKPIEAKAIRALIEDADWILENVHGAHALDAALISAAQCIEYYEMAGYAVATQWAEMLGEGKIAKILKSTLTEEETSDEAMRGVLEGISSKAADEKLASISG